MPALSTLPAIVSAAGDNLESGARDDEEAGDCFPGVQCDRDRFQNLHRGAGSGDKPSLQLGAVSQLPPEVEIHSTVDVGPPAPAK